jgi:hypothetical protein
MGAMPMSDYDTAIRKLEAAGYVTMSQVLTAHERQAILARRARRIAELEDALSRQAGLTAMFIEQSIQPNGGPTRSDPIYGRIPEPNDAPGNLSEFVPGRRVEMVIGDGSRWELTLSTAPWKRDDGTWVVEFTEIAGTHPLSQCRLEVTPRVHRSRLDDLAREEGACPDAP